MNFSFFFVQSTKNKAASPGKQRSLFSLGTSCRCCSLAGQPNNHDDTRARFAARGFSPNARPSLHTYIYTRPFAALPLYARHANSGPSRRKIHAPRASPKIMRPFCFRAAFLLACRPSLGPERSRGLLFRALHIYVPRRSRDLNEDGRLTDGICGLFVGGARGLGFEAQNSGARE